MGSLLTSLGNLNIQPMASHGIRSSIGDSEHDLQEVTIGLKEASNLLAGRNHE